ncbi:hypothetical protein SLE2022_381900 [Rubroshorea leprosula]
MDPYVGALIMLVLKASLGTPSGDWVRRLVVSVGITSSFVARLGAISEGLRLCNALGLGNLVAEKGLCHR